MEGYKTSKDYKHLVELLEAGKEVVCFVTYNIRQWHPEETPIMVTDVCRAKLIKGNDPEYRHYLVGVRGHVFIEWWNDTIEKFTFEELCEAESLEYIEPDC